MTQFNISQAHILQNFQFAKYRGDIFKAIHRLIHCHFQNIGNSIAFVFHLQGFPVIAPALANLAGDVYVGQKVHLDLNDTVAGTGVTAPAANVETEPPRLIAAHPGFSSLGEQFADAVKSPGISGRIGPRGAPDRGLIDIYYFIYGFCPGYVKIATLLVMTAALTGAPVDTPGQSGVEDFLHQSAFARPGYSGNHHHHPQGDLHIDIL